MFFLSACATWHETFDNMGSVFKGNTRREVSEDELEQIRDYKRYKQYKKLEKKDQEKQDFIRFQEQEKKK